MENKVRGGLIPLSRDDRDINLGSIVKLPELSELPTEFSLGDTIIRNQETEGNDDFCTAYGTVGMAYLQDDIEGSSEWVFAASKEISGNHEGFGQDMRTAFKTWIKYGSPRNKQVGVPKNLQDRRYLKNYNPELNGDELKKKTFVTTKGQYSAYDNIRASIWKFREQKRAVGIGLVFSWPLTQIHLDGISDGGFGHFMFVTGWNENGLEVVNSYGKEAGKDGKHYLARVVPNIFQGFFYFMQMIILYSI